MKKAPLFLPQGFFFGIITERETVQIDFESNENDQQQSSAGRRNPAMMGK
jgi:hypothetical protein